MKWCWAGFWWCGGGREGSAGLGLEEDDDAAGERVGRVRADVEAAVSLLMLEPAVVSVVV